jgi:predicted transcriptional regulator
MTEQAGPTEGERTEQAKLVQLTAGVVAAYLSRNVTSPSELPNLIDKVGRGLQEIG